MRKLVLVPAIIVLLVALILVGCAAPAPAPVPAPAPAPAPAPSPAPKPAPGPSPTAAPAPKPAPAPGAITLRYNDQNPRTGWEGQHAMLPWIDMVEKGTNGKIKFEIYDAQTLAKGPDPWEATKNGLADVSWAFMNYWPNITPLSDVVSLPFMAVKSAEQGSGVLWQLYQKYPTLAAQYKDVKVLLLWTNSPYFLVTTKKQVKTLDDMKGLIIRVIGGPPVDSMKALGGVPVTGPMPESYINLQKGVYDGMGNVWEAMYSYKQYEVVKYYTYVPLYMGYFAMIMNNDKWNSLPKDVQDALMASGGGIKGSTFWGKSMFDTATADVPATVKSKGFPMEEYTLPPAELEKWTNIGGKPLWEKWVAAQTAAGRPEAKEILATTLDLIKNYTPGK